MCLLRVPARCSALAASHHRVKAPRRLPRGGGGKGASVMNMLVKPMCLKGFIFLIFLLGERIWGTTRTKMKALVQARQRARRNWSHLPVVTSAPSRTRCFPKQTQPDTAPLHPDTAPLYPVPGLCWGREGSLRGCHHSTTTAGAEGAGALHDPGVCRQAAKIRG